MITENDNYTVYSRLMQSMYKLNFTRFDFRLKHDICKLPVHYDYYYLPIGSLMPTIDRATIKVAFI